MTRVAAAVLLLAALGCASGGDTAPVAAPAPDSVDARLHELQTSMTELLERIDVLNARLAEIEAEREAPAPRAAASTPAPQPAAAAGMSPVQRAQSRAVRSADLAEQYRSAIVHYSSGRIAEARAAFQGVLDADPSSELADNALFWIGETYYGAGDMANAITHYRRVGADYSDQNKAPDALYKLALAYAKTGDLVLARKTLQDVIARYPYSTAAASSRAELDRIKY
jgi:tol-pal system protein YbgF